MRYSRPTVGLLLALLAALCAPLLPAAESPRSAETGRYSNLFSELPGRSESEIDAKIEAAWRQLFHDDDTQRVYYPVGDDLGDVADILHNDVHTEGQSYGTLSHVALGWAWWGKDPWQVEQSNCVLAFLATLGPRSPDQMALDGTPRSERVSHGLPVTAVTPALTADSPDASLPVQRLWDADVPSDPERSYDGLLHMFALLQVSGRYRAHHPPSP